MTDTYKCAECGETFEKGWSDEEAIGEARAVLGTYDEESMAVVCDDCYQKIMAREEDLVEKWMDMLPTEVPEDMDLERVRAFCAVMLERQAALTRKLDLDLTSAMLPERVDLEDEEWCKKIAKGMKIPTRFLGCDEDPGDIDNDDPLLVEGSDFVTGNEGP